MKIEMRPITDIKPYPNNPRINDDAVDTVAGSDPGVWISPTDRGR
jgi:hypothetical protein